MARLSLVNPLVLGSWVSIPATSAKFAIGFQCHLWGCAARKDASWRPHTHPAQNANNACPKTRVVCVRSGAFSESPKGASE